MTFVTDAKEWLIILKNDSRRFPLLSGMNKPETSWDKIYLSYFI